MIDDWSDDDWAEDDWDEKQNRRCLSAQVFVESAVLAGHPGLTAAWFDALLVWARPVVAEVEAGRGEGNTIVMSEEDSAIEARPYRAGSWRPGPDSAYLAYVSFQVSDAAAELAGAVISRKRWIAAGSTNYEAFSVDLAVTAEHRVPDLAAQLAERVCAVMRDVDVLYGDIAVDLGIARPMTALDHALGRDWDESLGHAREVLRGYGWSTILPGELAARLGGAEVMQRSAGVRSMSMPSGAVLVRADASPLGFLGAEMRPMFLALAPVLPPGLPKWSPSLNVMPNDPQTPVVYEDASRVAPG